MGLDGGHCTLNLDSSRDEFQCKLHGFVANELSSITVQYIEICLEQFLGMLGHKFRDELQDELILICLFRPIVIVKQIEHYLRCYSLHLPEITFISLLDLKCVTCQ